MLSHHVSVTPWHYVISVNCIGCFQFPGRTFNGDSLNLNTESSCSSTAILTRIEKKKPSIPQHPPTLATSPFFIHQYSKVY